MKTRPISSAVSSDYSIRVSTYEAPQESKKNVNLDTQGTVVKSRPSTGSAMRGLLLSSSRIRQLRKTALLKSCEYRPGMVLPDNYEIASHSGFDGRQFNIVGKRNAADPSRFHAKNPATGKFLCVLKRAPTNDGGCVWIHPEESGLDKPWHNDD